MILPPGEKIIETKLCRLSGQEFFVTDKDLEFYDNISPVFNGKKYTIPSPTLCPDERQKRRLAFRNENYLYKRTCAMTGKDIVSMYSPASKRVVYDHEVWWQDSIDMGGFQRDFDFSRSFFQQFQEFCEPIPFPGLYNSKNENSRFNNYMIDGKNCYMSAVVYYGCENILYSKWIFQSRDIVDSSLVYASEYCHDCVQINNCHNCRHLVQSNNCSDCLFSKYLSGCRNCILCSSLSQKQYHILNIEYSPEEYQRKKEEFLQMDQKTIQNIFHAFLQKQTVRNLYNFKCENCFGDSILNSKDSFYCFDAEDLESCKYITGGERMKNSMDGIGGQIDNSYEFNRAGIIGQRCFFVNDAVNSHDVFYCLGVYNVSDCFACSGLRSHEHHCILNKPYSIQEYETLCRKIIDHMRSIGEWGEFFPHELSPFGYNETVAQEYFPMTASEVSAKGWNWYDEPEKTSTVDFLIPLHISLYNEKKVGYETAQKNIDQLLQGTLLCEITKKSFKIIKQELISYIEHSIPIPTLHPDQRHKERMNMRNPRTLYERECAKCGKTMMTTYAPTRPEKVVCEECYRKLVY